MPYASLDCNDSLIKTRDTLCDNKLSHLDPIGIKPSSELIAAFYYFIKFDYASYLIDFVYLFEEAAHVLTGGLQRDRGVGLMT